MMRNPLLVARLVFFAILTYLNLLALGFAAWTIAAMERGGSHHVGPAIFVIINAGLLFFFLFVAMAEMIRPDAKTAQVNFECGWTAVLSILQLAAAIDITINGPVTFCRFQNWMAVCASTTVLVAVTWASSILMLAYFLMLLFSALAHHRSYPAVWSSSVFAVAWFDAQLEDPADPTTKPKRPMVSIPKTIISKPTPQLAGPYENPSFGAQGGRERDGRDEQGLVEVNLTPPSPAFVREQPDNDRASSRSSRSCPRVPPSPAKPHESFRPGWAKRIMTRRGIDPPFYAWNTNADPSQGRQGGSPPLGSDSKTSLPEPRGLDGGHLDVPPAHRISYSHFPEEFADPDRPIVSNPSPRGQWVPANNGSSSTLHYTPRVTP